MEASGARLRAARGSLQITVEDLAEISGVPAETIRRLETGAVDHDAFDLRSIDQLRKHLRRHGVRFIERGDVVDAPGLTFDRDPDELLDEAQAIKLLEQACARAGSVQGFAKEWGLSAPAVFQSLSGKRRIHGRVANVLGIRAVKHVHYIDTSKSGVQLTPSEARARLQDAVDECGSQAAFAQSVGVEKSTVSNQLAGRHLIGGKVATALHMEPVRQRVYRRMPATPKE